MKKYLIILTIAVCFQTNGQTTELKQADSLFQFGNYTKAINLYKSISDKDEMFHKIAKAYNALGNYDEAIKFYQDAIQVNQENHLIKYEYAKLLSKTKRFNEASGMFYKLINIDYKNPNFHYELGLILEHLKDSTAQNRFYSAFQLDSTHQKAIFRLARFHVKKRHFETANKYIDIGLKSYSNNKDLISLKAQNYYWQKDYENAVKWFDKLISLNESSQFIHEKLCYSYSKLFEDESAIEQGLKALEYDPKNAANLYILGQLYYVTEDFSNAEKYMLRAIEIQDISLDEEYGKLGFIFNRQSKHKEAIEAYQKAITENPAKEDNHFFLALSKDRYYEDIDERIKVYDRFKEKFPKSMFNLMAGRRIEELKKEKFLKEE